MSVRAANLRTQLRFNKYAPRYQFHFEINPERIFARFAGVGKWEEFQKHGTIILPGIFDYIVNNQAMMQCVDTEFQLYNYHYFAEGSGQQRRGWLRNMVYSLIQQLVRMDPVYYALNVACRPDLKWRLISVPYYTKDASPGESTGFQHLDMNVHQYFHHGAGPVNMIQGSLSLDNEDVHGCTMVVKGFHNNIYTWWKEVIERGCDKRHIACGNTDTKDLYTKADQAKYGAATPTPCLTGGIRLTRAEIIHGSTGSTSKRRRVIFPWYTGLEEDHDGVDIPGAESWGKLAEYHRDMTPPKKQASGRSASSYGENVECLIPKVWLQSSSYIGSALVGRIKWDGVALMRELSYLFGENDEKAHQFVQEARQRAKEEYEKQFGFLQSLERETFGDASFFLHLSEESECPVADGTAVEVSDLEDFQEEVEVSDAEVVSE